MVAQNGLPPIIRCLRDGSLIDVAVPVLFNICTDFGRINLHPYIVWLADNS